MQFNPKIGFVLGIFVTIETAISGGLLNLTNAIPTAYIPSVVAWSSILAFAGSTILTFLHAFSNGQTGPMVPDAPLDATVKATDKAIADLGSLKSQALAGTLAQPTKAPAIALLIGASLILGLLQPGAAYAQAPRPAPQRAFPAPTGNPAIDIPAAIKGPQPVNSEEPRLTGDPVADLHAVIEKGGAKLILHLKQTYALASAPGADGSMVDPVSAPCAKALVPIVDLVVNGPKMGAIAPPDPMAFTTDEATMNADKSMIEGLPVKIEKIRILRISLTSQALTIACGPLVQDEVKQAKSLIGGLTSLMTGAGLLGVGL